MRTFVHATPGGIARALVLAALWSAGCTRVNQSFRESRSPERQWQDATAEMEREFAAGRGAAPQGALPDGANPSPPRAGDGGATGPIDPTLRDPSVRDLEPGFTSSGELGASPVWTPGRRHPDFPNISAGEQIRHWRPDPGYEFASKTSLEVRWVRGVADPKRPNVISGELPDVWRAAPGYTFVGDTSGPVRWQPGLRHPDDPRRVASQVEGTWARIPAAVN